MLRRVLLGSGLLPLLPAAARGAPGGISFRVMREGLSIGSHTVRFRDDGDLLRARTEMRIEVKLMGFTVFRLTQDTEEAWRGGRLAALASQSDRNGRPGRCEAMAGADGIRLRGTAGNALVPPDAAPLTWWRAASLREGVPLFDVRDGRPVAPRLERRAEAGGQRITLIGGEGAEVVYDAAGNWVGFATTGEDGSAVQYQRA